MALDKTNRATKQVEADRDYWNEFGRPFGLKVYAFTAVRDASFIDPATNEIIHTKGMLSFLTRIRAQITGEVFSD